LAAAVDVILEGISLQLRSAWRSERTLFLQHTQPQTSDVAFEFVRSLAAELSAGRIDLPSFPEVAIRVRRVLGDPTTILDKVVRVVGSEPALAARLLRIANSATLNPSGKPIADLRNAINRMGYNMVRSASISFAMAQIRNNDKLAGVKQHLDELWERSTHVAALAYMVARSCTTINPDEAMLTGMLHGIGKLYVLTRAAQHPALFNQAGALEQIITDWHAEIAKAILENWQFTDSMVAAVADQNDLERVVEAENADLSDVIAVALLMASFSTDLPSLALALDGVPAVRRLGLDAEKTAAILNDTAVEISALRSALGH
jgi:HD-like signal output (HDOD) protein